MERVCTRDRRISVLGIRPVVPCTNLRETIRSKQESRDQECKKRTHKLGNNEAGDVNWADACECIRQ